MASLERGLLFLLFLTAAALGCAVAGESPPSTHEQHGVSNATSERGPRPSFHADDVVIAIDRSSLALLASGTDVDRDGIVGRDLESARRVTSLKVPPERWTTDPDDTVGALQLEVARALAARLALRGQRVGLASFTIHTRWRKSTTARHFSDEPLTVVSVGPPEPVLVALAEFPPIRARRHTDLARLLEVSTRALDETQDAAPIESRAILLFSAGEPNVSGGLHSSSERAIESSLRLAERGIEVWAIPFGIANVSFLERLTRPTGGDVVPLEELDAVFGLPAEPNASGEFDAPR
jgi:hypothetical protein